MTDIPTMLLDLGSSHIRASLTTDDTPRLIIPSAFPSTEHDFPVGKELPASCEPSFAIADGEVDDEDRMNFLFATIFDEIWPEGTAEPVDLRVVLTNMPYSSKKHTSYISQATFELLSADSIIMKPPALYSLTLFSLPTCICLDVGYDIAHIVPIQDSFVCSPAVSRSFAAGSALDLVTAVDRLQIKKVTTWAEMEMARKKKELLACCSLNLQDELDLIGEEPDEDKEYALTCGELLFNPTLFELGTPEEEEPDERISSLVEELPLASFVQEAIEKCDLPQRGKLWSNIIVTGGTTLMKGFRERLQYDLNNVCPPGASPKLRFPDDPVLSCWYGQKLCINCSSSEPWLNRLEYEEDPEGVYRKFVQYGLADPNEKKKSED